MTEFLDIATSLPTAPFALAMGASVSWWLLSLARGLDHGHDGHLDAHDGHLDAHDGHLDGHLDAHDGHLDAHDGHLDAHDGHVDGHGHDTVGSAVDVGSLAVAVLRLGKVPITVFASLFSVWGWVLSFGTAWLFRHPLEGLAPHWTVAGGGVLLATVGGLALAGLTSRPLEPLFRRHHGRDRASLAGETAEVTTSRVDGRFGQARLVLGGDDLVVQIRNDRADNGLLRGHQVLLVGFDHPREAWIVEPVGARRNDVAARARQSSRQGG